MKRTLFGAGLVMLVACGIACSMCHSPFDYSGPVVSPNGVPQQDFHDRQNSVLGPNGVSSDGGGYVQEGQEGTVVESAQTPTPTRRTR